MSVDTLRTEIEKFIIFSTPEWDAVAVLATVAVVAWITVAMLRRVIGFVGYLARAVMVAVAGVSAVLAAGLVLAVLILTG